MTFIRRLLPKTLFGQLIFIMLTGLIIAQLLAAYVLLRDRGAALYQSSGRYIAQRIASVIHLTDSLSSEQRALLIPSLNTPTLRVSISDTPVLTNTQDDVHSKHMSNLLSPLMNQTPFHVKVIKTSSTDIARQQQHKGMGRMRPPFSQHQQHMQNTMPNHFPGQSSTMAFYVVAQLSDGRWINLSHQLPQDQLILPYKLLLTLAVLLLPILMIALFAVRKITQPLHTLGKAAEAFGRDIHHSALKEQGPQEVQQTIRAFNDMQQHIAQYIQDRERFLAAVSHDLKTPITRLRLRTEMLDDETLRNKFMHDLSEMEQMTGATLDYIRDEQQNETVQPIDVMALLESLQADHEDMGETITIAGNARAIKGKPNALRRCLDNVVNNAVKYAANVEIEAQDSEQQLIIRVKDSGPGLSPQQLEQVFEPFYRVEASRNRDTGGVGLGLSIARGIARAHGGDLTLHNREMGGLEAVLVLPH